MSKSAAYNVAAVRRKFPALNQVVGGVSPVYLDNPGGTQVHASGSH